MVRAMATPLLLAAESFKAAFADLGLVPFGARLMKPSICAWRAAPRPRSLNPSAVADIVRIVS